MTTEATSSDSPRIVVGLDGSENMVSVVIVGLSSSSGAGPV